MNYILIIIPMYYYFPIVWKALDNYSMLCFIGNPDELVTIAKMEFYMSILQKPTTKQLSQVAALNGWRLLATTVNRQHIYDTNIPE